MDPSYATHRGDLVVVANAHEAHLFARDRAQAPLRPLETLLASASSASDTGEPPDRGGHVRSDQRPGGTTLSPRTSPEQRQRQAFARTLARRLEAMLEETRTDRLAVFAAPAFLGELRAQLSPRARRQPGQSLAIDLLHGTPHAHELERRVERLMAEPPGASRGQ